MIALKQFDGSNVTPKDDAILYDFLVGDDGILSGCTVTHLGAGQLRVADGRGIIMGRCFVVEAETMEATLAESGTLPGRLLIRVDIADVDAPIKFVTQAADPLPELVKEDINGSGTVYELPLATYTAEATQITGLTSAIHTVTPVDTANSSTQGLVKLSAATTSTSGVNDGIAATPSAVKAAMDAAKTKAPKATHMTATLLAEGWTGDAAPYTYTLAAAGVTASGAGETDQVITIPHTASDEVYAAFQAANIRDGGQGDGTVILKALGDKPEIDIPILIINQGPSA